MAERITLAIAARAGRDEAADAVHRAAASAQPFRDALLAEPVVDLSAEELDELLDPSGYLGSAEVFVDRALQRHREATP